MKKGFTLIELLVVIGIIGLLASIVLASLGGSRVKASRVASVVTLRDMLNELHDCLSDNGYGFVGGNPVAGTTFVCQESTTPNVAKSGHTLTWPLLQGGWTHSAPTGTLVDGDYTYGATGPGGLPAIVCQMAQSNCR